MSKLVNQVLNPTVYVSDWPLLAPSSAHAARQWDTSGFGASGNGCAARTAVHSVRASSAAADDGKPPFFVLQRVLFWLGAAC